MSIADGVLSLMSLAVDEYLATGVVPGPGHSILTGRYACYDTYRCADDRWVAVGAIEPRFYANLCRALDCERWIDHQLDDPAQEEIRADFRAAFERKPRDQWVDELGPADTCVGPVYSVPELVDDPHLTARGLIVAATDEQSGAFRQLAPLLAGSQLATTPVVARPAGRTDTDQVLAAAGLDPDRIAELRRDGVVA